MTETEAPQPKTSRISRRLLVVLVAAVVVIAGVGVAAYFLWFSNTNKPPVADFQIAAVNNLVVVNASASSDPDGTVAGYEWDFGDGGSGTGIEVSHTYLAEGNFTITLRVKDDVGAVGSKSDTFLVALRPVPVFSADVNLLNVTVDASEATALRGTLESYAWDWGDGSPAGSGEVAYHVYAAAGNYTIELTATDSQGKSASSSQQVAVDPTTTIYTQLYGFCDPTFQKNWELRRSIYGDLILRNTYPAVEEYPWGFYEGYANHDTALYCLHRIKAHGVNVPNYNMNTPVFWPYLAPTDVFASTQSPYDTTGQVLSTLLAVDGSVYTIGPGQTLWVGGFDVGSQAGKIWSASIVLHYATDAGTGAGLQLKWSLAGGANQTQVIKLKDTGGASTADANWTTLSPATVTTWSAVRSINISIANPQSGSVYVDALEVLVYYETPAPAADQGSVQLNWYINYATEASSAEMVRLGYMDTTGVDDGYVSDLRGTYTMDYATSQRIFGVSGDPAAWWAQQDPRTFGYGQARDSALERAWMNWITWNGNYKYDVFDAYEYFFQIFAFELNATVVQQGSTNLTVVNFRMVAWGGEVLLMRWFYWGPASYMKDPGPDGVWDEKVANDDVPTTPLGWNGQEMTWWEQSYFNATVSTALTFTATGVTAYQFGAGADAGPDGVYKTADDTPNWNWNALNADYVNDTAHPRSEVRYYWDNNLSYVHTTPGALVYGKPYYYDVTPTRWNLRPGETLVFHMPRGMMIWFDPVKSVWDSTAEAGKGAPRYSYYFAPLTIGTMDPAGVGLWDEPSKVLSLAGPFPMPDTGVPPAAGLPGFTWVPAT